jgi:hypothetical protein
MRAVCPELAAMLVGMARGAFGGKAQPGAAKIAHADGRPRGFGDVIRRVAARAGQASVFALQRIPGLPMVELFDGTAPTEDNGAAAHVFSMAASTILNTLSVVNHAGVVPGVVGQTITNLRVTLQALQACHARAEHVTPGTIRGPAQIRVRLR